MKKRSTPLCLAVLLCCVLWGPGPAATQDGVSLGAAAEEIPQTAAGRHVAAWLAAHQAGDAAALEAWIRTSYTPEKVAGLDMDAAVGFYSEIVKEFLRLAASPHTIMESTEHRLMIQFADADVRGEAEPDPTRILVVEVDVDPENERYLARGLGLGSLACELHK